MSISSDGQLSFGVPFEEDFEFPWDDYDNDIDDWWKVEHEYLPLHHIWDASGNYAEGFSKDDPRVNEQYEHKWEWEKANPIPIELVTYCSYDYPMILITVSNLNYSVSRGSAELIPHAEKEQEDEARKIITEFCQKYNIEIPCEPDWYLTSLYG